MRARWLAPVLLLACSGPDDKGTDGPDYDSDTDTLPESTCAQRAGVEITLPQGTVTGDVAVTVSLRDMDSETASLDLQWSTDGIVQHPLHVHPVPVAGQQPLEVDDVQQGGGSGGVGQGIHVVPGPAQAHC